MQKKLPKSSTLWLVAQQRYRRRRDRQTDGSCHSVAERSPKITNFVTVYVSARPCRIASGSVREWFAPSDWVVRIDLYKSAKLFRLAALRAVPIAPHFWAWQLLAVCSHFHSLCGGSTSAVLTARDGRLSPHTESKPLKSLQQNLALRPRGKSVNQIW